MDLIKSAEFIKSSAILSECPEVNMPEFAFIGRSNVGKSSLINFLTNRKQLAKVSVKPGKTQLINHFFIDKSWYLVDLPGYGWAKVSKTEKEKWRLMINEYLQLRENLHCVFLLIDSRHEPQAIDLEFMRWLGENEIPFVIVFTKTDKLSKTQLQKSLSHYREVLSAEWEELPVQFETSTVSNLGKEELINYIRQIRNK
ncbi:MAG: YihA family ribosome biogenesis GTP-binding protein [Flammeovirgaceae bacterium]|jgi:GTP-binding protein|nr:YihA family ribosome biogenesis GTP-binding protein [Flammeovirgaceae bacterium]|tara:strand:+ start:15185 stop:15781 length:597 start_codon:yes stop_codon:yes gene_type:complete